LALPAIAALWDWPLWRWEVVTKPAAVDGDVGYGAINQRSSIPCSATATAWCVSCCGNLTRQTRSFSSPHARSVGRALSSFMSIVIPRNSPQPAMPAALKGRSEMIQRKLRAFGTRERRDEGGKMKNVGRCTIALILSATVQPATANGVDRTLFSMAKPEQVAMLAQFVRLAHGTCPRGTRAMRRGVAKGDTAYWALECSPNGADWLIKISAKGIATISPCAAVDKVSRQVGRCWQKFSAPPSSPRPQSGERNRATSPQPM
jgi:hypothetical protein